jgi:hypothetical protein
LDLFFFRIISFSNGKQLEVRNNPLVIFKSRDDSPLTIPETHASGFSFAIEAYDYTSEGLSSNADCVAVQTTSRAFNHQ